MTYLFSAKKHLKVALPNSKRPRVETPDEPDKQ